MGWIEVATTEEFQTSDRKRVELGPTRPVALFRVGTEYFAVDAKCTHANASLLVGEVRGYEVICPLHGARFDLRTGRALSLPAVRGLKSYPVKVEGNKIFIKD